MSDAKGSILISGASGLLGRALLIALKDAGYQLYTLKLGQRGGKFGDTPNQILWFPEVGHIDKAALDKIENLQGVIHLAGENIGARWSEKKKKRILDSRVNGTDLLAKTLAQSKHPPAAFLCASGVGYYGDQGDQALTEDRPPGSGFLAEVCVSWEGAADPLREKKWRVCNLRLGMVLSGDGGALKSMVPIFKWCVGGVIGSGRQYWSWIALEDAVSAIQYALEKSELSGPLNFCSPQTVTAREFTKTLGRVLHRPTIFPVPSFVAKAFLGEMAEELLLSSQRAIPKKLLAAGYKFQAPDLEQALKSALK